MDNRTAEVRSRYLADGDLEAVRNLDAAERRALLMRAGRTAEWGAIIIALAIGAADVFQFRITDQGFYWNLGHVVEATHHWLWVPLALFGFAATAYRKLLPEQ